MIQFQDNYKKEDLPLLNLKNKKDWDRVPRQNLDKKQFNNVLMSIEEPELDIKEDNSYINNNERFKNI